MADTTWYVDPDATGANDGTSWADAYQNITGANSLQTAIDQANDADNTTVYVRYSGATTNWALGASELTVSTGGSPWVTSGTQDNNWLKIIGCDAAGDPITTRGTRLVIQADQSITRMLNYTSDADRVVWYNFEFDCNGGNATNGISMTSSAMLQSYLFGFVNCAVRDGDNYPWQMQSDADMVFLIDCDVYDDAGTSWYGFDVQSAGLYCFRCHFRGQYTNGGAMRLNTGNGAHFEQCVFDSLGVGNYPVYFNNSWGGAVFNKCAFINYLIDAFNNYTAYPYYVFKDCYFEAQDSASDGIWSKQDTWDHDVILPIYTASNLSNRLLNAANLGNDILDPYLPASVLLSDGNTTNWGPVSATDYRNQNREDGFYGAAPDFWGNRGTFGPENMNGMTEAKRRRRHV
ncbi:MAG: hypothetical protein Unbinned400contig1000_21 [Prokaryotic dsDNA virus sp.]|nr:MAG: hypothetical protein Unbinned400contig1000_21 [Prokaryotic dsDNA virus sp.]